MKSYIQPVTLVSELLLQQPLATSNELPSTPDMPGLSFTRHRNALWEDDEDDWLTE